MRIFVIYRHYWPDTTSYARILRLITERLAYDGHEVIVFSAQPSYNDIRTEKRPIREAINGVSVFRMPLLPEKKKNFLSRVVNSLFFMMGSFIYGVCYPKIDLSMAPSTPPVLMGATIRLLAKVKRIPYIYHCQDLQPEVGLKGEKFRPGRLYNLMRRIDKKNTSEASSVVVLSGDMAKALRERGLTGNNIKIMNNFIIDTFEKTTVPYALLKQHDIFRVLFTGNHGVFQGLNHVIQAAELLKEYPCINFQFVGEGLAKDAMKKQAGDLFGKTIFFHPYVSPEIVYSVMLDGDLGMVPLQRDVYKYAYPSKTMMLLAAGLPIVVMAEPESELARFVRQNHLGWIVPPEDASSLAEAILEAYKKWQNDSLNRNRIQLVAEKEFGIAANLERWSRFIGNFKKP